MTISGMPPKAALRNMSPSERREHLIAELGVPEDAVARLAGDGVLSEVRADAMIENVIGVFEMPIGIATNFVVNGKEYLIPMAVEEPSVVAAASHMAKIARQSGGFSATGPEPVMRAQIQVLDIADLGKAKRAVEAVKDELIQRANACDPVLVSLGGGCRDIEVHDFADSPVGPMLVLHLIVDVRDAMGANAVNTMAEALAPAVEQATGARVLLRILSNLADLRVATAQVRIPVENITRPDMPGARVAQRIVEAAALAVVDPYRAATHNKGIMNGIDPVVVATGNDWRAIEAGAHAYAARDGRYTALSTWSVENNHLIGEIALPMALGLVGGATKSHPAAQAAIEVMQIGSAGELAGVVAAVGLAQNLAALRALATEGIQKGHMALHARNVAISAGAQGAEIEVVARAMVDANTISVDAAHKLLKQKT